MRKQKANIVFVNFDLDGAPMIHGMERRMLYKTAKRTYINRPLGGQQDVTLVEHGPYAGCYATWGYRRITVNHHLYPKANVRTPTLFAQWLTAQQRIPTNDTVLDPRD